MDYNSKGITSSYSYESTARALSSIESIAANPTESSNSRTNQNDAYKVTLSRRSQEMAEARFESEKRADERQFALEQERAEEVFRQKQRLEEEAFQRKQEQKQADFERNQSYPPIDEVA